MRYPEKSRGVFCKGNAVKYATIASMRSAYPVRLCCALLEVSASGFHAWLTRKPRQTTDARDRLAVVAAHEKTRGVYGAVRLYYELWAEGFPISLWKVKKLRRELGLVASRPRRRMTTTDSRHKLPVAGNVLDRRFSCESPNTAWVSDITHIPTDEGWLYLAGIKDCCTKEIVGYHFSDTMTSELVIQALQKACTRHRPGSGLILHSDRGSQYCGHAYQREINRFMPQCSMSRKGNCHDNAPMESFWGLLKTELVYRRHFPSHRQAMASIKEYIEIFYNLERRQAGLGYLSPAAFARKYWQGKMSLAA